MITAYSSLNLDHIKMGSSKDTPILTLSIAASLLNMHSRTLMLYEKEDLIKTYRTSTNRRLFSQSDLNQIQFIKYLITKEKVNMAGAKVIIRIIEKAQAKYPNIRKEFFPEYAEKKLI